MRSTPRSTFVTSSREDADLVVSLVALTTFQPSNDPDLSRTEIEFPIADDITFRRYTYKIITPELDEIEATGVAFVLGEQPMKLDTGMSFGTDPYRGFNGKMRSVENLEELRGVATEYLDVVFEAREKRLSELRDRLSGTVKLNIWDFIYCSVAAFTTLGTGDIVPASTLTRLVVALEALVALLIGGFGVELFLREPEGPHASLGRSEERGERVRNEADTRAELIEPLLAEAGWGKAAGSRVRREVIAPGRLIGAGRCAQQDIADIVLIHKDRKLAVIEAKKEALGATEGLAQAKRYAAKLGARFAYSTNGREIYRADMETGEEGYTDAYLSPAEMWDAVYRQTSRWRDAFGAVPYEDKGGQWQPRYYQHNAITRALEAIEQGKSRVLLTLATGTGKTAIAFQIAWKLFQSRWNLTDWKSGQGEGTRRPRILFLADRNILANQAFTSFGAFPDDAMVRIDPEEIRKQGRVPKNGSVFFTIFQTFMTGRDKDGEPQPSFYGYPSDFFDLIIVDECHRGGAQDESTWRGILEYFEPAVQIGLTATPKRKINADTYAYFGEPVYVYSLKEGINDGFLTPFKVKQIQTTLDEYVYTSDDEVLEGEVEEGKRYREEDFNRVIEIRERERARVKIYMDNVDQSEKSIVFCATQEHAAAVRDLDQPDEVLERHGLLRARNRLRWRRWRAVPPHIPGQRKNNPGRPDNLSQALDRCRRAERETYCADASHQINDRVQADHRPWHASLRRQRLFHDLGLRQSLRALQRPRVGRRTRGTRFCRHRPGRSSDHTRH